MMLTEFNFLRTQLIAQIVGYYHKKLYLCSGKRVKQTTHDGCKKIIKNHDKAD